MSAPSLDVLNQVRQALDEARQAGKPAPGRPTLARLIGATDHSVRMALAVLAEEPGDTGGELVAEVASPGDSGEPQSATDVGRGDAERAVDEPRPSTPSGLVATPGSVGVPSEISSAKPPAAHQLVPVAASALPKADPVGGRLVAWAGFVFGSLTSVAGNVLAARLAPAHAAPGWHPNAFAEVGAAVWPIALLLSVEALSRIRWPKGALWALARFGGAGAVALCSALISYSHIAAVLNSWGYQALGARVGPLVVDGLMIICGFALLATAGVRAGEVGEPAPPAVASAGESDGDPR